MDLLKKHYEKIVLGIVLLGLAVGTAFLPIMIARDRDELKEKAEKILSKKIDPLPPLNLTHQDDLFKRSETPLILDFSGGNRLFNPVPWGKKPDGSLIRMTEGNVGPKAVVVTKISPLFTTITLDSVTTSESGARYVIGLEREAAAAPALRRKKQYYASANAKNDAFIIREVKGTPEDPSALVIELNDSGDRITLTKEQPFKREDGYLADMKYDPERKTWVGRRVGDRITFGGEEYIVVAISKGEVVLSAKSNNKKTPIQYDPAP